MFDRGFKKEKPTEAQVEFAEKIAEKLDLELPEDFTREAYSGFISEWKDDMYFEEA